MPDQIGFRFENALSPSENHLSLAPHLEQTNINHPVQAFSGRDRWRLKDFDERTAERFEKLRQLNRVLASCSRGNDLIDQAELYARAAVIESPVEIISNAMRLGMAGVSQCPQPLQLPSFHFRQTERRIFRSDYHVAGVPFPDRQPAQNLRLRRSRLCLLSRSETS
jgi:hypothetical protein